MDKGLGGRKEGGVSYLMYNQHPKVWLFRGGMSYGKKEEVVAGGGRGAHHSPRQPTQLHEPEREGFGGGCLASPSYHPEGF